MSDQNNNDSQPLKGRFTEFSKKINENNQHETAISNNKKHWKFTARFETHEGTEVWGEFWAQKEEPKDINLVLHTDYEVTVKAGEHFHNGNRFMKLKNVKREDEYQKDRKSYSNKENPERTASIISQTAVYHAIQTLSFYPKERIEKLIAEDKLPENIEKIAKKYVKMYPEIQKEYLKDHGGN